MLEEDELLLGSNTSPQDHLGEEDRDTQVRGQSKILKQQVSEEGLNAT